MIPSTPPETPSPRRLPVAVVVALLAAAFLGFYLGLKKVFGDADMAGARCCGWLSSSP